MPAHSTARTAGQIRADLFHRFSECPGACTIHPRRQAVADTVEYVLIDAIAELPVGRHVTRRSGIDLGWTGQIVAYARSRDADDRYRRTGDPECLMDSEGPLVRWDGAGDLDWFPGQAMSALDWSLR